MNSLLSILGLILVVIFILMGLDDFIWDMVAVTKSMRQKKSRKPLDLQAVHEEAPKMRAVMIAAWHEDNVIGEVIDHFIATTIYPQSMYHIFLGVYPNDKKTISVVKGLERKYPNVHGIINELNGPTSKAQNINYMIQEIEKMEEKKGWEFDSFTVHDSEDVVNPYELRMTNYLMKEHGALQFPVFPLMEYPTFRNFFKNITTNTYADEFAEHHYLTMVYRDDVGAFVPSAGTGFALRRDVVKSFEDGQVLPTDSLTEDYKLALQLYKKGTPMHYVLMKVPNVNASFEVKRDYVATRSRFPNTFKTAVRQKKRWITGITMQSVQFKEIFESNGMSIAGRYSLYRDQKAKVGNLIAFIGYPFFIYFILDLFLPLPVIFPQYSLAWWLSILVTIMMIERQIFRMVSIYNVYGIRSVFFSTLLPPILPVRYVWGNLINFTATFQAYWSRLFPNSQENKVVREAKKQKRKENRKLKHPYSNPDKELKWDKTDHEFLPKDVLLRYYQKAGDIFIKRGYITPKELKRVLEKAQRENYDNYLGLYLYHEGLLSEEMLIKALADVNKGVSFNSQDIISFRSCDLLHKETMEEFQVYPLFNKGNTVVMVMSCFSPYLTREKVAMLYPDLNFEWNYATKEAINSAINNQENSSNGLYSQIESLYDQNAITSQQGLLALNLSKSKNIDVYEALLELGVIV